MGRHRPSSSYGHELRLSVWSGEYVASWIVDYYYRGCRTRFPRLFQRVLSEDGARRFAKKWGVPGFADLAKKGR